MKTVLEKPHLANDAVSMVSGFSQEIKAPLREKETEATILGDLVIVLVVEFKSLSFRANRDATAFIHRKN